MGTFSVDVEIGSPDGSRFETVSAMVDTGASITALPGSLLRRLGVIPHRQYTFELADGREIRRGVGRTWIRVGSETEMTLIMFSDENVVPLLGALSLQELLLAVDSPNERLIPSPRLLM